MLENQDENPIDKTLFDKYGLGSSKEFSPYCIMLCRDGLHNTAIRVVTTNVVNSGHCMHCVLDI